MEIEVTYKLSRADIDRMPFNAFYEYGMSNFYNTGTHKRLRKEYFTEEELSEFPKLKNTAYRVYTNPSGYMCMPPKEYKLWQKIGKFLYEKWCVH